MKQIVLLFLLSLVFSAAAPAQGIDFFHGTWPEALAKAKSDSKYIFVDAFASWCGPCKKMASTVFTDAKVGDFFNANFICLKIDMEKPENSEFAGKFPVSAYPTLMFIDGDGKLVSKDVGAKSVTDLIAFAQKVSGFNDKTPELEKGYSEGNRDPKFLLEYVKALNKSGKPSLKITNEYLQTQKDLTTDFNLQFILEGATEADSRVFELMIKNRDKIKALEGEKAVPNRVELACNNTVKKAVEFQNEALLQEAKDKMAQYAPEKSAKFAFESDKKYYAATKNAKMYLKVLTKHQKKEGKNDASQLYELSKEIVKEFPKDADALKQAEKWNRTAAENGGLPEYWLSLADLYNRQGNREKALETGKKALKIAQDKNNSGIANQIEQFLQFVEER